MCEERNHDRVVDASGRGAPRRLLARHGGRDGPRALARRTLLTVRAQIF